MKYTITILKRLFIFLITVSLNFHFSSLSAQGIDQNLKLYRQLSSDPCVTRPEKRKLLSNIEVGMREGNRIEEFARFLSEFAFWSTTDTDNTVDRLIKDSIENNINQFLATKAIRSGEGQLDEIIRDSDPLNSYNGLKSLYESIMETDGIDNYLTIIQIYRISVGEKALFTNRRRELDLKIEEWMKLLNDDEIQKLILDVKETLNSTIKKFDSEEFADLNQKYFVNDLRFRKSILQFLSGDRQWSMTLYPLFENAKDQSKWFDANFVLDHVYVNKFFEITPELPVRPLATNEGDDNNNCPEQSVGEQLDINSQNKSTHPDTYLIQRNYNPLQMAAWACVVFTNAEANNWSLAEIHSKLKSFRNADYRIVLSHHNGKTGRFSKRSVAELKSQAKIILDEIKKDFDVKNQMIGVIDSNIEMSEKCREIVKHETKSFPLTLVEGKINDKNRYFALESRMTYRAGKAILAEIRKKFSGDFSDGDPYLLRPGISG